jgi:hypothetical protein
MFFLTNYISELQLTIMILQKSFKHAFKIHFNSWTFQIIKDQIGDWQKPKVDFKMANLKT